MTIKLTSGGIDKGAFPMCDSLAQVAENDRAGTFGKAGSRKHGIETEIEGEDAIALSKPRTLVVDNIARLWIMCSRRSQFLELKVKARDERTSSKT
jgi:hypothetical protein